ncbi:glycoside hydrolase family 5 protein, partial [Microbacterium enclense]
TATPKPTPKPTASPAPASVAVAYLPQSAWGEGYVSELTVTAAGPVTSWTASWESPGARAVVNAWGMTCSVASSTVTCRGDGWAASPAPGQTVRVGLQVAASSAPTSPRLTVTAK